MLRFMTHSKSFNASEGECAQHYTRSINREAWSQNIKLVMCDEAIKSFTTHNLNPLTRCAMYIYYG